MMGWYNGGMGTGGWIAMTIFVAMFWGLVIFACFAIFRGTRDTTDSRDGRPVDRASYRDPVDILDERFARGEVDSDDYETRKAVLRGSGH